MTSVDELVDTLLYEGYALYPYTPGATKNATPTPFGIVYPPVYADGIVTFDRLIIDVYRTNGRKGVRHLFGHMGLSAEVRFLEPAGPRHQGVERRVVLNGPGTERFEFDRVRGEVTLALDGERVTLTVKNESPAQPAIGRAEALQSSLISTHVVLRTAEGRFVSPLERTGESVNSFPVLADEDDTTILGAAIVLPDHPQIAPESHGSLFDATEIEEALLLHVLALSDEERASIAEQDPAVRQMIERAAAATPDDIMSLHGRLQASDPPDIARHPTPEQSAPPLPPPGPDATPGEETAIRDGVTYARGMRVRLRADKHQDAVERHLDGKTATIERIMFDYGDKLHLGVIVEDDPGAEILRETGRFVFFFPEEVEVLMPTEEPDVSGRPTQILVAGVGNAFMGDDGFGGHVAKALEKRGTPDGVHVFDFGTGGLDLAYEVMRGYDALVLVDISRQGEPPGTLFVIEVEEEESERGIEDGDALNPHAMDPQSVLRFVRTVGGWPGRVMVVGCEPATTEAMGFELSDQVAGAVDRAADLVLETVEELCTSFR